MTILSHMYRVDEGNVIVSNQRITLHCLPTWSFKTKATNKSSN